MNDEYEARGDAPERPLSISQLNWTIKNLIESSIPKVWAEGEISDLSRPSSGHYYFTLKDDKSQIRAVIWRSTAQRMRFKLKDGLAVVCCGAVEVYSPRGSYQLIVRQLQPKGIGELQLAFQQLHQKLSKQGLFDPARKKPLPSFPHRIGFVTSPNGAAIHDFIEAASHRWPDFHLTVIPASVQGENAVRDITRGIRLAQKLRPKLDTLIVGRGGGSLEDLWCFNEEAVVRTIAACTIPTISAVGHEIDITLSDLAADQRALTPTNAATLLLPSRSELTDRLYQIRQRLQSSVQHRLQSTRQRLDELANRSVIARPHSIYKSRRQSVDEIELQTRAAMERLLQRHKERLASLARAAEALSPLGVLQRGYSLTRKEGDPRSLRSSDEVQVGELIETKLANGSLTARVESTMPPEVTS